MRVPVHQSTSCFESYGGVASSHKSLVGKVYRACHGLISSAAHLQSLLQTKALLRSVFVLANRKYRVAPRHTG